MTASAPIAPSKPILLRDIIDFDNLTRRIQHDYITVNPHPSGRLVILSYGRLAQYENAWDTETITCRGLIVTATDGQFGPDSVVVARPFPKFFSPGQHAVLAERGMVAPLPDDEPFVTYDKADGSLGIFYRDPVDDQISVATRGSFTSPQALWATEWVRTHAREFVIPAGATVCAEIIQRQFRIVLDYGDFEGLILLAGLDNRTGGDVPVPTAGPHGWGHRVVATYDSPPTVSDLTSVEDLAREGYVIQFASGARAKVKFDWYAKAHKTITRSSPRTVWARLVMSRMHQAGWSSRHIAQIAGGTAAEVDKLLAEGDPILTFLDRVPDEFDEDIRALIAKFDGHVQGVLDTAAGHVAAIPSGLSRKELFERLSALSRRERSHALAVLDGEDITPHLWRECYPNGGRGFWSEAS